MTYQDSFLTGFIKAGIEVGGKLSPPTTPATSAVPPSSGALDRPTTAIPSPITARIGSGSPAAPFFSNNYTPSTKPKFMANGPTKADAASLPNQPAMDWKLVGQTGDKNSMSKTYQDAAGGYHHITDGAEDNDQLQAITNPQPKFTSGQEVASMSRAAQQPHSQSELLNYGVKPVMSASPGIRGGNVQATANALQSDDYAGAVIQRPDSRMFPNQPQPNQPLAQLEHNFQLNQREPDIQRLLQQLDPGDMHTSTDPGIQEGEIRELMQDINRVATQNPGMARDLYDKLFGQSQPK